MFLASTMGGGMCLGFPDVCKVPAPPAPFVPVPFPNMAQCAAASPVTCTLRVKIMNMPALHTGSEIPLSQGDEGGTAGGGMISGTIMQKVVFRMGSMKVKVEGNPLVTVMKATAHNGSNPNMPMGQQLVPSQPKVIIGA